jgi:hypothetical protein
MPIPKIASIDDSLEKEVVSSDSLNPLPVHIRISEPLRPSGTMGSKGWSLRLRDEERGAKAGAFAYDAGSKYT